MLTARSSAEPNGRSEKRLPSLLGGKIIFDEGRFTIDCAIKDISEAGARIRLAKGQSIASEMILVDLKNRTAHHAIVKWMRPPLFGLQFSSTIALSEISSPELAFLKGY